MRAERQKIEDAKAAAVAARVAEEQKALNIARLKNKVRMEEAVLKQAQDILARLEKGLDRYIRQPSGQSEQALNLYTDNIRAFVQAKAKAQEELNKVQQRVDKYKRELAVCEGVVKPVAPVIVAPKPTAPTAPAKPASNTNINDGFGDVVPVDLQDLVDENAPALKPRSAFEMGVDVIPNGIEDIVEESTRVEPLSEEPFAGLLPIDAKDLLEPDVSGAGSGIADIDDGEFEALKNEAGLGDVDEGRRLSVQDELTTLLFGDANTLAL